MDLLRADRLFVSRYTKKSQPVRRQMPLLLELLEDRMVPSSFRTIDGTGNNLNHSTWGSAGVDLLRVAPAQYADGISTPGGVNRPSARVISNTIADQGSADIISDRMLSAMVYAWGQFIDHDLDLTPNGSPAQAFNVQVPTGDPYFDPNSTGTQVIQLNRSLFDPATGTSTSNPRQQVNVVTAWLDGSQVYGSDAATALKLRTLQGGRLKTSPGGDGIIGTADDLLPYNNSTYFPTGTLPMANDAHLVPDDQLFAAGDVRANENIELTSLQTLFVREHNRIAGQLKHDNPSWNDETIYQNARARVIGEMQAITFRQWLPSLLGSNAVPAYRGYNAAVNPGIANEFSTAIFRLGHSLLGDDVEFLDNNGMPVADPASLSEAFFNPPLLTANGISPILKYLSSDPSSELDTTVVNSVRNFLFGPPGAGGLDLASLNIQRGRDHGLADYNSMRAAYGLPKVTSFAQITHNVDVQGKLQQLYGNVNNVDAWVGALAEDHLAGSSAGPLIQKVMIDQFTRLRDGDRFWYQRVFSGSTLQQLDNTTLADVISRNSLTTNLQDNVFFFRVSISGTVFNDANRDRQQERGEQGLAGLVVQLIDAGSGAVVLSTTTNSRGNYSFDVSDGLGLGRFRVQVTLPGGAIQTTPVQTVALTRGETFKRVDIGVFRGSGGPSLLAPSMMNSTNALAADGLFL
jgi:peroxidase